MRYRKLDADGDYTFGRGAADMLVNSREAVAQAVTTRLKLWTGEWFLDKTEGTPWLQDVLSANLKNTTALYDLAIRERVLGTPHVTAIIDYASNLNSVTRHLDVSMKIATDYGGIQIVTQIAAPDLPDIIAPPVPLIPDTWSADTTKITADSDQATADQ